MATGKVVLTVVDVGQGQCTFVEIYNTADKLIHTLILDCGSSRQSDSTTKNINYIADTVLSMTTPAIDCVFLSHGDADHINLLQKVLQRIKKTIKPVIKEVWYAGKRSNYTKGTFNILDEIESKKYCPTKDINLSHYNYSGYSRSSKKFTRYFWKSTDGEVSVYGVASNVLSNDPDDEEDTLNPGGKTPEARNRVSMICGLYFIDKSFVICGDATNVTMQFANKIFKKGTTVFDDNQMTTLPHHGSRSTGLAVASAKKASDSAVKVVKTFSGIMKSQTITVSSFELYKHPSLELINHFIPTDKPFVKDPRLKETNTHRMVANMDITLKKPKGLVLKNAQYYSFNTTSSIFGTRYSRSKPIFYYNLGNKSAKTVDAIKKTINPFASWMYILYKTGKLHLNGYSALGSGMSNFLESADKKLTSSSPEIIPPVSIRNKNITPAHFQPARLQSGFHHQLKQFR